MSKTTATNQNTGTQWAPPPYEEADPNPRTDGPFIPDDFKYSVMVSSCEPLVRQKFMHKVYSILSAQLLASLSWSFFVTKSASLQTFVIQHLAIFYCSMVLSLVTCFWLAWAPTVEELEGPRDPLLAEGQQPPSDIELPWYALTKKKQMAMLAVFTAAEAYCLSLVTMAYDANTVLSALVLTSVVVVGVTLASLSERFAIAEHSFSSIYFWLNYALLFIIGMGLCALLFGFSSMYDLIYGWMGAVVFTIYLFVDTQLIFRKVSLGQEVKCAMSLYLDIVNLFLSILRIMSHGNDE